MFKDDSAAIKRQRTRRFMGFAAAALFVIAGALTAPAFGAAAPATTGQCAVTSGSASFATIDATHIRLAEVLLGLSPNYVGDSYELSAQNYASPGTVPAGANLDLKLLATDPTAVEVASNSLTYDLIVTNGFQSICTGTITMAFGANMTTATTPTTTAATTPATTPVTTPVTTALTVVTLPNTAVTTAVTVKPAAATAQMVVTGTIPAGATTTTNALAFTGANVKPLIGAGIALIGIGFMMVWVAMYRRDIKQRRQF